jgi:hypothetical protein
MARRLLFQPALELENRAIMKRNLPFSWKAIGLAPLTVPLLATAFMALTENMMNPSAFVVLGLFFMVFSFVSYGATIFMFLPSLFVISLVAPLNCLRTCAVGAVLGGFVYLPVSLVMYKGSGPDSGPPIDSYWHFMANGFWALTFLFMACGLLTALAYWFLAKQSKALTHQPGPKPV